MWGFLGMLDVFVYIKYLHLYVNVILDTFKTPYKSLIYTKVPKMPKMPIYPYTPLVWASSTGGSSQIHFPSCFPSFR